MPPRTPRAKRAADEAAKNEQKAPNKLKGIDAMDPSEVSSMIGHLKYNSSDKCEKATPEWRQQNKHALNVYGSLPPAEKPVFFE